MSAWIKTLNAELEVESQARLDARDREIAEARDRLCPLEQRLARLLATIPPEVQCEGLSLPVLQASLKGRWRGNCHPGELGRALRKLGFERRRRWQKDNASSATWHKR